MWPLSTAAGLAVAQSHGMTARATVYSPTFGVLDLPIAGGQVVDDATSMVRRTATVQVDPRYWPASPQDLLAPYGSYCQVDYGIVLPSGDVEWVPLIFGLLGSAQRSRPLSGSAEVSVSLVDLSAQVAEDRFDAPTQTVSGATVVAEITRLIHESLPNVTVTDLTGSTQLAPVLDLERERWRDGVERLAEAIGAEVFFGPQGVAVIRAQPTLADSAVWWVDTGETGNIVSARDTLSRENVYNRVIVSGQRSDGTAPVSAIVSDTDPNSPTLYGGPFGKRPRYYTSALLTTTGQCTTTGQALLDRVKGAGATVEYETLVNPALASGDVIVAEGVARILDKVTTPLTPEGTQPLGTRSLSLPPES